MKNVVSIFLIAFVISGCSTASMTKNLISSRGEVLKEYEKGNDSYMVVKEGDRINKYRLYSFNADLTFGTQSETVYSIDTLTRTCAKGNQSQAPVDCQLLKRDKDLKEYINW